MSERSVAILGAGATSPYGRVNSDHCARSRRATVERPKDPDTSPKGRGAT